MSKLLIFGTGLIAEVAHFYFTRDTDHQIVGFANGSAFIKETIFMDLPIIPFESIEKQYPPKTMKCLWPLGTAKQIRFASKDTWRPRKRAINSRPIQVHVRYIMKRPVGENCFILENNVIQPFVTIGNNVTLWSGNHIGHHSVIQDHCFISSHVVISGSCCIEKNCFLGVNATLRDNINIGKYSVIGSGAIVMKDCEERSLVQPAQSKHSIVLRDLDLSRYRGKLMNISWGKKGLIFVPSGEGYFKTHVTRSIPYQLNSNTLRLFFSSRASDDIPYPTYIDLDLKCPSRVLQVNQTPMMHIGRTGAFDDSGITPTCILRHKNMERMYYVGWKRRRYGVSIEASIGLADILDNGNALKRVYEGPVLGQDRNHPFMTAAPFVLFDENKYKMWYCSGTEWRLCDDNPEPIYTVFYAESADGINWEPHNNPVIEYKYDGEVISAPWVLKTGSRYHMWYSTRGSATKEEKNYVIGYAESLDGIRWTRLDDQAGITRSESGWDSEMICYPSFFAFKDIIYMFYSGNNVGKGGVGYAVAENFL